MNGGEATKADSYAARIEAMAKSGDPDALEKIALEARLLRAQLRQYGSMKE